MSWIHPSEMTVEQRREANASVFDRFARAHEKVAARGTQVAHQQMCADSAKRVAAKIRKIEQ